MAVRVLVVIELSSSFEGAPSKREASASTLAVESRSKIDFFKIALADVGDPEVSGCRVERELPRVT